jgi:hypothetical protein
MRILFDECVPRRLCLSLTGHDIHTVPEMGWSGRRNGELLELMIVAKFELFITVDQNLRYQRNLAIAGIAGIAVVVLIATPAIAWRSYCL